MDVIAKELRLVQGKTKRITRHASRSVTIGTEERLI